MSRWKQSWAKIGNRNPWIAEADDPVFDESMLVECKTPEELTQQLIHGNWCLGQGFYWKDQCWINQINGGDEFLVIKQNHSFESVSARRVAGETYQNRQCSTPERLTALIRLYDETPIEKLVKLEYEFEWGG